MPVNVVKRLVFLGDHIQIYIHIYLSDIYIYILYMYCVCMSIPMAHRKRRRQVTDVWQGLIAAIRAVPVRVPRGCPGEPVLYAEPFIVIFMGIYGDLW